jgi:hypothetical protein
VCLAVSNPFEQPFLEVLFRLGDGGTSQMACCRLAGASCGASLLRPEPGTGDGMVGLAARSLSRRISMWSGLNIVGDKQIGKQSVQPRHRTYALRVASRKSRM